MLKFLENMEAGPNKNYSESGGKDMGPSHDFSHVGADSPLNTWT